MTQSTLEKRLASIEEKLDKRFASMEQQLTELKAEVEKATQKDWRRTIGMFAGDEVMKRIDAEGRKIREADRERARKGAERAERRAKK